MAKAITRATRIATRQNPTISNGPTDFPLVLPRVVVPGALVFVFPVGPVEAVIWTEVDWVAVGLGGSWTDEVAETL